MIIWKIATLGAIGSIHDLAAFLWANSKNHKNLQKELQNRFTVKLKFIKQIGTKAKKLNSQHHILRITVLQLD